MTARPRTIEKATLQREIITALRAAEDPRAADRLQRCLEVRLSRRHGSGWPWTCRASGCAFCGPAPARRWWRGIERWIGEEGAPVSLVVLPLGRRPGGLRTAVARLRRALRDVRDRAARRRPAWGGVAVAGMATGDDTAFLLVRHHGVSRHEIAAVLRRRWPAAVVGEVGAAEPSWPMSAEGAVELARARRGVEPLRIVVMAQRGVDTFGRGRAAAHDTAEPVAPMPIAF
ncbi:MAG: hypothetical protein ICV73_13465 [Acetobacteraceae bacterium]|nr:hypothetical protein [Acetobacteraceae bacterium]